MCVCVCFVHSEHGIFFFPFPLQIFESLVRRIIQNVSTFCGVWNAQKVTVACRGP